MKEIKNDKTDYEAFILLLKDLYKTECMKTRKYLFIIYILVALFFGMAVFNTILYMQLSEYEDVTVTETYDYEIEGDGASVINGDQYQYNDNATHNDNKGNAENKQKIVEEIEATGKE